MKGFALGAITAIVLSGIMYAAMKVGATSVETAYSPSTVYPPHEDE